MQLEDFLHLSQLAIQTAVIVSAPVLILGLTAGVVVSIVQAATQINDAALAFIPKIAAAVVALLFFGSWMISQMATFATFAFDQIPNVVH